MDIKKALIYDWYTVYGGAERCNESFNNIWRDLEHFALIDFLNSAYHFYYLIQIIYNDQI